MVVILNYCLSVSSSTTPTSQDSTQLPPLQPPSPPRNPRETKVLLPNKKPVKWSTGVAPGEYGGPPVTTKLRKYWGGEGEDPITSSDFIWNKDFMGKMEKLVQEQADPSPLVKQEESSGFLSLNRVMSLDSLDVDLSATLTTTPQKIVVEHDGEITEGVGKFKRWKHAPTRREQEKWGRATQVATGGSDVMFRELRRPRGDPQVLAANARQQYLELKKKMQILTMGIGSIGLVSAYVSYSPEIAASFGAGFLGSLIYIRMLGNTVDSMASEGARGMIKGAVGQPRLLVPVALVMIYNRWNGLVVPEYGLMHLELIPMLVGFFTYKIATFAQAIEEALFSIARKSDV